MYSKRDLQKRPKYVSRKLQRHLHKRPMYVKRNQRMSKETYKRDLPKRPAMSKETNVCKKRRIKEARESKENYIQGDSQKRPIFVKRDQCMSKETRKVCFSRNLQKRPTKETYKRDLQKRPTKENSVYLTRPTHVTSNVKKDLQKRPEPRKCLTQET